MLAKKFRFPIQLFVGKKGKIVKSSYFLLKIFTSEAGASRFGVTISNKTAPKATERNKFKRMVYNFAREYYKEIPIADYWLTILSAAVSLTKEDFKKELSRLLITNH